MIDSLKELIRSHVPDWGGTLLFGSSVEKRLDRPPQDWDVVALSLGPQWLTGVTKHDGQTIELFARRIDKIFDAIVASRDFFDMRNVAAGRLIDWPEELPIFPKLKRIAEVNWPKGPLRPGASSHLFMRLKYQNMKDESKTRAYDDVTRAFLHAWTLDHCISDFYRFYGLYLSKWSYLMGYLKVRDAKMHSLLESYLLSCDLDSRDGLLRTIVEHHLAPFGGYPPKEFVVRTGVEYVRERDDETGEWRDWTLPALEEIQPMRDAYKIGINPETAAGQEFEFLGAEYSRDCTSVSWWDDPRNEPLPYVDDAVRKLVKHYAAKDHVMGVIVFGSHGLGWAKPDSDVDLYIVTERSGKILEKRFVDGVEFGIEFVNFTDVYRGILTRRNTSYWRNFKESKILFSRHPSVPFMVEMASMLFTAGMPPLPPDYIILYRKRLYHILEDGDELLEKGDIPGLLYNDNLLFCDTIKKWFRLHNWLDTKRTYVMREIKEKDEYLYDLCAEYLLERDAAKKHETLRNIIVYVLEPYGGQLPEEWAIPVVPHQIRDEDIDKFLEEEGVAIPVAG